MHIREQHIDSASETLPDAAQEKPRIAYRVVPHLEWALPGSNHGHPEHPPPSLLVGGSPPPLPPMLSLSPVAALGACPPVVGVPLLLVVGLARV
jgi:hypothetical protein